MGNHPAGEGDGPPPSPVPAYHGGRYILTDHPPCSTTPLTLSHSPTRSHHRLPPERAQPDPAPIYPYHTTTLRNHPGPIPQNHSKPSRYPPDYLLSCHFTARIRSKHFSTAPCISARTHPVPSSTPRSPPPATGRSRWRFAPLSRPQIDTFLDIFFNRYPINRATSGFD